MRSLFAVAVLSAALAAATLANAAAPASLTPCQYYDANTNSNFDLTGLSGHTYSIHDAVDTAQRNYTYVYAVCSAALAPLASCPAGTSVGAYQAALSIGSCHTLNNIYTNTNWSLIDPADSTKGVVYTYLGGDRCSGTNLTRSFSIRLKCIDKYNLNPTTRVLETSKCHYELEYESMMGCPVECPSSNLKICDGFGVCGYDTDLGAARCFCDADHTGAGCLDAPESPAKSCDGVCVALSILVVLLAILVVVSCVIFYRVHKLEKMNVRFTAMSDNFVPPGTGGAAGINA